MQSNHLFILKAHTNLHAGSGEQTYALVDNMVQRDPTTEMPIVQSSSLKGAFKDFADVLVKQSLLEEEAFKLIFGTNDKQPGEAKFLQADLLAFPVRSSHRPYYLATTKEFLAHCQEMTKLLDIDVTIPIPEIDLSDHIAYISDNQANILVEDYPAQYKPELTACGLPAFLGCDHVALFSYATMKELTTVLPILARNKINDKTKTSENLFYEEVVPRQSRMFFFASLPETDNTILTEGFKSFVKELTTKPVQIGANFSIGYGLTEIREEVKP